MLQLYPKEEEFPNMGLKAKSLPLSLLLPDVCSAYLHPLAPFSNRCQGVNSLASYLQKLDKLAGFSFLGLSICHLMVVTLTPGVSLSSSSFIFISPRPGCDPKAFLVPGIRMRQKVPGLRLW